MSSAQSITKQIQADFRNFRLLNDSPVVVLESNYFSAYRGALVIRFSVDNRSFSFGVLFIQRGLDPMDESHQTIVRHEYGHFLDFLKIGPIAYLAAVGIPSILSKGNPNYYELKWEASADNNVGIKREGISQETLQSATDYTNKFSPYHLLKSAAGKLKPASAGSKQQAQNYSQIRIVGSTASFIY